MKSIYKSNDTDKNPTKNYFKAQAIMAHRLENNETQDKIREYLKQRQTFSRAAAVINRIANENSNQASPSKSPEKQANKKKSIQTSDLGDSNDL